VKFRPSAGQDFKGGGQAGDSVKPGDLLLVLETMKIESRIEAPRPAPWNPCMSGWRQRPDRDSAGASFLITPFLVARLQANHKIWWFASEFFCNNEDFSCLQDQYAKIDLNLVSISYKLASLTWGRTNERRFDFKQTESKPACYSIGCRHWWMLVGLLWLMVLGPTAPVPPSDIC